MGPDTSLWSVAVNRRKRNVNGEFVLRQIRLCYGTDLDVFWLQMKVQGLRETDVDPDPFQQFRTWLDQALAAQLPEPLAMALATADSNGRPSNRLVLLRGFDERGFVFFTNYQSRKGQELEQNPQAALVFYWAELDRQARIEGTVERVSVAESDAYFQTGGLGIAAEPGDCEPRRLGPPPAGAGSSVSGS